MVTLVESLTHASLLINNVIGMAQNIRECRFKNSGVVAVERILVKFDYAANGVAKCFRRDGAPMGTSATNAKMPFYNGNPRALFYQTHGGAFTTGT